MIAQFENLMASDEEGTYQYCFHYYCKKCNTLLGFSPLLLKDMLGKVLSDGIYVWGDKGNIALAPKHLCQHLKEVR